MEKTVKKHNPDNKEQKDNDLTHNEQKDITQNDTKSSYEQQLKEKDELLQQKSEEINSLKNLLQRRQADFENFRKRSIKLEEQNKKFAIKDIALDIMNVHDDLIRASDAAKNIDQENSLEKAHESYVEGVLMISKNIESVLGKYGIEEIEALDQPFDPMYHEAVEIDMSGDVECDTVTRVHQKGFKLEDFVIRSAKVRVSKAMVKNEVPGNEEEKEQGTEQNNDHDAGEDQASEE